MNWEMSIKMKTERFYKSEGFGMGIFLEGLNVASSFYGEPEYSLGKNIDNVLIDSETIVR